MRWRRRGRDGHTVRRMDRTCDVIYLVRQGETLKVPASPRKNVNASTGAGRRRPSTS